MVQVAREQTQLEGKRGEKVKLVEKAPGAFTSLCNYHSQRRGDSPPLRFYNIITFFWIIVQCKTSLRGLLGVVSLSVAKMDT